MGRAPTLWVATVLAVCLALVQASVIETKSGYQRCVQNCNVKENSLFQRIHGQHYQTKNDGLESMHFEQGHTYRYLVRTSNEANTAFKYSADESLNEKLIGIEAIASITPLSECELSMRLSQIKIHELKELKQVAQLESEQQVREFIRQLETPVVFGYADGLITELCTESNARDEDWYALNLKKSIISTMQTAPQLHNIDVVTVVEPDFHGECETQYQVVRQSSDKYLITKEKDLSKCSVNSRSLVQSSSAYLERNLGLNATVHCEQKVENQMMTEVECIATRSVDTYVSHFDIELVSRVEMQLLKVERSQQNELEQFSVRRHSHHLMMSAPSFKRGQNQHQRSVIVNGREELKTLLSEMCQDMHQKGNRVTLDTPEHVQELARLIRDAQPKDVEFIWRNMVTKSIVCQDEKQAKKIKDIFVDTAASVMNMNALPIVRDELLRLLKQQQPNSQRARYLATLISFAANPESEAVEAFVAEMIEKTEDAHIILSLSALVKKVKDQHQHIRQESLEKMFNQVLRKVAKQLNEGQREVQILRLLKALKNIVPASRISAVQERLFTIIFEKQLPAAIRVHALQALEALELTPKTRQALIKTIADRSEKNEVRITAYRTIVEREVTIEELKELLSIVLKEEESNLDIFNYIAAHQKNLRSSSLMAKRSLLPMDAPLFPEPKSLTNFMLSRNFEWAFVNPKTSIGAVVEADMIMSKESRVPRYVTFNLTVPVAEQQQKQIPIVEVTIRQEGLEQSIMEHIERLQKVVSSPAAFVKQIKSLMQQQQQRSNLNLNSKLQVFINIDGKNVYVYDSTESQAEQKEFEGLWDEIVRRIPIRFDETAVIVPFQHRVHIPTASGVPVTLELNTTLVGSLETNINGQRLSANGDAFFDILFKPTLVAEFGVGMEANVESVMSRNQIKRVQFVNRFITAPTFHLKTELKQNRQVRAKLILPEQEQIIARFETFFTNEDEKAVPLMAMESSQLRHLLAKKRSGLRSASGSTSEKCFETMDKWFGVTLCKKEFSTDDLRQSLSTRVPRKLVYRSELRLVKTDRSMEGIEMMMEYPQSLKQEELKFHFHFDTPNSSVKRHMNAEIRFRVPNTNGRQEKIEAHLEVQTPNKRMAGQMMLLNRENEKGFKIELLADGNRRQFLLELGTLATIKNQDNAQVKVQLKIQPRENIEPIAIRGELAINKEGDKKRQVQVKFEANEKTVFDFGLIYSGKLFEETNYKLSTHMKVDLFNIKIDSNAQLNKDHKTGTLKSLAEVKYSRFWAGWSQDLETIEMSFQMTGFKSQEEIMKKFIHWSLKSTQLPQANHELTYTLEGSFKKQFNQEFTLKWSEDQQKMVRMVQQTRALQNPRNRANVNYDTKVEVEITPLELAYTITFVNDAQPMKYTFDLKVLNKRTNQYPLETRVRYVKVSEQPLTYEAEAELKADNGRYTWQFKDQMKEIADGVYQGEAQLEALNAEETMRRFPKRVQLKYVYKTDNVEFDRESIKRSFVAIFKAFKEFEHELIIDAAEAKQIRESSLIAWDRAGKGYVYRSKFEMNQTPLYAVELSYQPKTKHVKAHFESAPFRRFLLDGEAIFNEDDVKMVQWKVSNDRFHHQTVGKLNLAQRTYEVMSLTKKTDGKTIVRFEAKKDRKTALIQLDSEYLQAELKTEQIFELIRTLFTERSVRSIENAQADLKLALPRMSIEHQSLFNLRSDEQMTLESETKKENRNLFRYTINLVKKGDNLINFEYLNDYKGKVKITEQSEGRYEMTIEARADKYQWTHNTQVNWEMRPASYGLFKRSFRLHQFATKNHMQDKSLFDATYRLEANQEMPHKVQIITRDSHVEMAASKFDDRNELKALVLFRTKRFGNIEHKTELKRLSFEKQQMVFASKTTKAGEEIFNIELDASLEQDKESWIRVQTVGDRHLKARFVPWQSFDGEVEDRTWLHQIKAQRQSDRRGFQIEMNCHNKQQNKKWTTRVEHQCDRFTRVELDTPFARGTVELKMAEKSLEIELKGDGQFRGWEHRSHTQIKPEEKMIIIRANTRRGEQARFVDIEGEVHYGWKRVSTLKIEAQPVDFLVHIQCDPQVGGQVELRLKGYRHQIEMKRLSATNEKTFSLNIETTKTKTGERVVALNSQLSLNNIDIDFDSQYQRMPMTLKIKVNVERREAKVEFHNKRTDRAIKMAAELSSLKTMRVEVAWDAKRDPTKQAMLEVRVQPETSENHFVATVVGKALERPIEIKIDLERGTILHGKHSIQIEYNDIKKADRYYARFEHDFDKTTKASKATIVAKKNNIRYIDAELKIDLQNDQRRQMKFTSETDSEHEILADLLNFKADVESERLSRKEAKTRAEIVYGSKKEGKQQKTIKYELDVEQKSVRGQMVIDTEETKGQTIKFEWISPESKLQVNAFNRAGRQVDFNLDIAKALQKKFQIVSAIESIPTVNIELLKGENSRVVIEVSFKDEKTAELSFNWFGQWRRDFKLEALIKSYSHPNFELLMTSRHPAGSDLIEADLKYNGQQYNGMWNRKFEESKKNWNTQAQFTKAGEKIVDLKIERAQQQQSNGEVVIYKAQLDGRKHAVGQVQIVQGSKKFAPIEYVKVEFGNREQQRAGAIELYVAHQESATGAEKTGVRVQAKGQTLFGLVHVAAKNIAANKRSSLVHIELANNIEYIVRNEIEYHAGTDRVHTIRSELKRKNQEVQPIYKSLITIRENNEQDMKIARIEISSVHFRSGVPKVFEVRYNFHPKICYELEHEQKAATLYQTGQKRSYNQKVVDDAKCWRVEVLAGEIDAQRGVSFGVEYVKNRIDSHHYNRTARVSIQSFGNEKTQQQKQVYLDTIGHVSAHSAGLKWVHLDRYGVPKSGMYFIAKQPNSLMNVIVRDENQRFPSKDFGFDLKFSPKDIRRTLHLNTQWDADKLRQWVVGEVPMIEELAREDARQIRSKMVRNLKAEAAAKYAELKQNFDNELIEPIVKEAKEINKNLAASKHELVKTVHQAIRQSLEKVDQLWSEVDVEQWVGEINEEMHHFLQMIKEKIVESISEQCQSSKTCRRAVEKIGEYDLKQLIEKHIVQRYQRMQEKLERQLPADLRRSLRKVADEIVASLKNTEYQSEEYPIVRHTFHMLRMSKPVYAEKFATITEELNKDQKQSQLDWNKVKGSMHDIAVDVFDCMQAKTYKSQHQQEEEEMGLNKSYWNSSPYTSSDYNQEKKNKYNQNNEMEEAEEYGTKKNNSWFFNPKQGQMMTKPSFVDYNNYLQQISGKQSSMTNNYDSYWTRA